MTYDNMERYYTFYIKGLFPGIGWKQIYAGDDPNSAKNAYLLEIKRKEATKLREIRSYHKGTIVVSRTKSFMS